MRNIEAAWDRPDKRAADAHVVDKEVRVTDFLLFALVPIRTTDIGGFPLSEFALAGVLVLCLVRRPLGRTGLPAAVATALVALLVLMTMSGILNEVDWTRRVGHLGIWAGIIWAGATGRISLRSAALGMSVGLIAVIAHAYATLGASAYAGRLTGFLGDPNAGAYFLMSLGAIAICFARRNRTFTIFIAIPIVLGEILSYSRTGLLAITYGVFWAFAGRRFGPAVGLAVVVAMIWAVNHIPEDLASSIGAFSNRTGSDALRQRIIAAENFSLSDMPWYGHGPGTATIELGDRTFFFHSSYLALRQEGGWIALGLVLFLLAYSFIALAPYSYLGDLRAIGAQVALISVPVMAVTLGEVLLDTPASIAIAFALGRAHELRRARDLGAEMTTLV